MMQPEKEYAKALFLVSEERGGEDYLPYLRQLRDILREEPAYSRMMISPAISLREKKALILEAFSSMPQPVTSLLQILCDNDRFALLGDVINEYEALVRAAEGRAEAKIASAIPLTEAQKAAVIARLEAKLGKRLDPVFSVDPGLIGGIRAEVEGVTFDGTVKKTLSEAKDVMIG